MKFTNMKIADTCSSTNLAKYSVYKRQSKVNTKNAETQAVTLLIRVCCLLELVRIIICHSICNDLHEFLGLDNNPDILRKSHSISKSNIFQFSLVYHGVRLQSNMGKHFLVLTPVLG
jgi:hypothetical protein